MTAPRDESGFTIVELLVAMMVGLIVVFGALGLLETTTKLSARSTDRIEATSKARTAMDLISRQVRSQVCISPDPAVDKPALVAATADAMTFHASLAPESPTLTIQRRTLQFVPGAGSTPGQILETVQTGVGTRPNVTFPNPGTTRVIADRVVRDGAKPIFRYFKLVDVAGTPTPTAMTTAPSLSATERRSAVQVDVNFAVRGRTGVQTALSNRAYVRTSIDKEDLVPEC
jgi:Tfp pilus assembly protein PilW